MSARCSPAAGWSVLLVLGAAMRAVQFPAVAQSASDDRTVATLEKALRPGDRVTVTLPGDTTFKGKFVQLWPDFLSVQTPEGRRDLALKEVTRVQRTRVRLLLGPIVGALAGVGFAFLAGNKLNDLSGGDRAGIVGFWAGVGLGIDAAVNLPRTVYDGERQITFTPLVAPKAVGGAVRVTF